jgi:hypothetical protein
LTPHKRMNGILAAIETRSVAWGRVGRALPTGSSTGARRPLLSSPASKCSLPALSLGLLAAYSLADGQRKGLFYGDDAGQLAVQAR